MADQWGTNDAIVKTTPASDFGANDEIDQHNPLRRGWNKMTQSVGLTSDLATGDYKGAASRLAEISDYQQKNPGTPEGKKLMDAWNKGDGISGGLSEVGGAIAKDWDESKGALAKLRSVGRNVSAMGQGVLEQTPNMVAPMGGMLAGAAAGSVASPVVGTALGGWAGASLGNTAVEGGGMTQEALQKAGINPADKDATEAYLKENGDALLTKAGVKGSIIGAVDTLTAGLGHGLLTAPAKAAANRAVTAMGIDVADKAAIKAASGEIATRMAADPVYQAATSGVKNVARNASVAALEPGGEFAGEYLGQGVATGDWDTKNAFLEAASSVGQGAATFAGQKAYAGMRTPGGVTPPDQPTVPPEQPPVTQPPANGTPPVTGSITGTSAADMLSGQMGGLAGSANPLQAALTPQDKAIAEILATAPPGGGPLTRTAIAALGSEEIQTAQAVAQEQAVNEQAIAESQAKVAETSNQAISDPVGQYQESLMSDADKTASFIGDGEIGNGEGQLFARLDTANRRAIKETKAVKGIEWVPSPVYDGPEFLGFKVVRKAPNVSNTNASESLPTASMGSASTDAPASVGLGATNGDGLGANTGGRAADPVVQSGQFPGGVDAGAVTTRQQPTTLGTQTTAVAGPEFNAKSINVQNPSPTANPQAGQAPVEAPAAVEGNAATAQDLPGAGSAAVEGNGVEPKAKWLKAINDQNRLMPTGGVQLKVVNGKLTFLGNPDSTKQGRALQATLAEAEKAGATRKEIIASIQATDTKAPSMLEKLAKPKPKKGLKATVEANQQARADYFTPGNIVTSYGGHDEVLGYTQNDNGGFSVKVHAVKKVGDEWVRIGKAHDIRQHSTQPDPANLKAGPVARLGHSTSVKYTEPRADGKPFPNVPDRGQKPVSQPTESTNAKTPQTVTPEPKQATQEVAPVRADTPLKKTMPNVVVRDVRGFNGEKLGDIIEQHDGTKAGILAAAERTNKRLQDEYPDATHSGSRTGATDETGAPKWAISPNGQNIATFDSKEGQYIFGDLSAAPEPKAPEAPADTAPVATESVAKLPAAQEVKLDSWREGTNNITQRSVYNYNPDSGAFWANVQNPSNGVFVIEFRKGQAVLETEEITGTLTQVKFHVKERVDAMGTEATHKDPGKAPEAATSSLINSSMNKAAKREDKKPSEMRKWLLGEIDKALLTASEEKFTETPGSTREEQRKTMVALGFKDLEKAAKWLDDKYEERKASFAKRVGHVTFDVPGDGKFKVVNTKEHLQEFRAKVSSSPGFKDHTPRFTHDTDYGVQKGSGSTLAAIKAMIDEGDPQAAVDYAAAKEFDIAEAMKGDKIRRTKIAGLEPTKDVAEATAGSGAEKYKGPSDVSSRNGQMELANRAGTIATLKAMNAQLRAIAPNEAWADKNIEEASNLDGLRGKISTALVKAQRAEPAQDTPENQLLAKLEAMSGAELTAVFDKLNLAGARLTHGERVEMLLQEDAKEVEAAIEELAPETQKGGTPLTEAQTRKNSLDSSVEELAMQFDVESDESDFDPKEVTDAAKQWAKDGGFDEGEYKAALIEAIEKRGDFRRKAGVLAALRKADAEKQPWQMEQDDYVAYRMDLVYNDKSDPNYGPMSNYLSNRKGGIETARFRRELEAKFTREWYEANEQAAIDGKPVVSKPAWMLTQKQYDEKFNNGNEEHEMAVKDAIEAGKPVPANVLAEYPNLAKPHNTGNAGAELTYNKRNRIKTGINWSDIENKDDALKIKETNKQNVYPKPDYQALIDGGMTPVVAHIVKQVYDSIATTPKVSRGVSTDDQLKQYIEGVHHVMGAVMSWANNSEQTTQWLNKIAERASAYLGAVRGTPTALGSMTTSNAKTLLNTVYPNGWQVSRPEVLLIGGNKLLSALQPSTDEAIKAQKEIAKGWPTKQEAWVKQGYKIIDGSTALPNTYVSSRGGWASLIATVGGRSITISSRNFETATSKDDPAVQEYLKVESEAYKTRFVVLDKNNRLQAWGLSQEAAEEQARNLTKREAKAGKVGEKGISVESAQREGVEHRLDGEDVSSDNLEQTFGLKGVNFGNAMLGEAPKLVAERQLHLNHAYDALMDLAEILGVPPKALSLDGLLGLAIGAQGSGTAAAHFVPGVNEINLTRTNGAGSLAHEWAHALDHYFARQADLTRQSVPFLTSNASNTRVIGGSIRPEIVASFKAIVQSMSERKMTQEEYDAERKASMEQSKKYTSNWLDSIKRDFALAIKNTKAENVPADVMEKFDALAERVKTLDLGEGKVAAGSKVAMSPVVSDMRDLFKSIGYGTLNIEQIKGLQGNIDALKYKADALAAGNTHVPNRSVPSHYQAAATNLDGGKKTGKLYWSTKLEMFARAFDAFVSDALDAKAAKNTYLSHNGRVGETVPNGPEREAINADIQKLIETIETKETDGGNVAMFSRQESDAATGHIDRATLDAVVARVILREKSNGHAPIVVARFEDLPAPILAAAKKQGYDNKNPKDRIKGVAYFGRVYLVQENIQSELEAEEALLHEATHIALRASLSKNELQEMLGALYSGMGGAPGMVALASQAGVKMNGIAKQTANLTMPQRTLLATEEFLAEIEGQRAYEKLPDRAKRVLREFVGSLRTWLREHGFTQLAKRLGADLNAVTLPDLNYLLKTLRTNGVTDGTKAVRFMRSSDGSGSEAQLLAPNGKPSNLTAGQHAQVRTSQFKKWFGDWELAGLEKAMRRVRGTDQVNAIKSEIIGKLLTNAETGLVATVSGLSFSKMASGSAGSGSVSPQAHYQALGNLDKLFTLATRTIQRAPKKDADIGDIGSIHHFEVPMPFDGDVLRVKIMAKEFIDPEKGSRIYLVNAVEIESAGVAGNDPVMSGQFQRSSEATSSPQPDAGNRFSQMLDAVKGDGVSKAVDENGEPLVVYHATDEAFTVFDKTKIARKVAGEGFWFSSSDSEQGYGSNLMPVYLDIKSPTKEVVRFKNDKASDGLMFALVSTPGTTFYAVRESTQIKSSDNNNGEFDGTNPDIRFSRSLGQTLSTAANNVRNVAASTAMGRVANMAVDALNDRLSYEGTVGIWHKTFGSMYHLAKSHEPFQPVFNAAQDFINDVAYYASEASDLAPKLLPKLEEWKDIGKQPISAEDNKAIQAPIFEGTLIWMRDDVTGKVVKVEELKDVYAKRNADRTTRNEARKQNYPELDWTLAKKKKALIDGGFLDEKTLKMWEGQREGWVEKVIEGKFEKNVIGIEEMEIEPTNARPGIVFTPAELKSMFNLTGEKQPNGTYNGQIGLYQEFRNAIDNSLDNTAKVEMLRYAGESAEDQREMILDAPDADAASVLLRDHLLRMAEDSPDQSESLTEVANNIMEQADKVKKLKAEGYAPLSRFGQYSVDVVVDGNREYFDLFETKEAANQMAGKMRIEFGAANVKTGTMSAKEFQLFQGITPESMELFGNMLGLDAGGDKASDTVFQTYLRFTKNNRSAMKRLMHRKGIAGFSTDTGRVLASFIYSNARLTSSGLHMGAMDKAVQDIPKGQGQLKDAAIELREYIKNPREEAQAMRGLLFAQYLGGNVASMLMNFMQVPTVSLPYLSQYGGVKKATSALLKAMKDQKSNMLEKDLRQALKDADEKGITQPQAVHELMAQSRGAATLKSGDGTKIGDSKAMASNAVSKFSMGWGKLFGMAEQINRRSTFIAAYRLGVEQGVKNPAAFAENAVNETQFINNKANKAKFARGAIGGTLMTFKSYSTNYLELLYRLSTKNGPEGKKAALLMLGMLFLMAGAGGMPGAEDAEDLIDGIAQRMGYNLSTKKSMEKFLDDLVGRDMAKFIMSGVSGLPGSPMDISGRAGMGNLLPGTGVFMPKASHANDLLEFGGPAAGMLKRFGEAAGHLSTGNVFEAAMSASPIAIANMRKGVDMLDSGIYKDSKGYKIMDTNVPEGIMKMAGFQPQSVKNDSDDAYMRLRTKNFYNEYKQAVAARWANGLFESDPKQVEEARDMIASWNEKNPELPMMVNMPAIGLRLRKMRETRDERILKGAPKAMQSVIRQEMAQEKATM